LDEGAKQNCRTLERTSIARRLCLNGAMPTGDDVSVIVRTLNSTGEIVCMVGAY